MDDVVVMMRSLALVSALFAVACADTSSVTSSPVCDAEPTAFELENHDELTDAAIDAWAEATHCRVDLLRRDTRAAALAADADEMARLAAGLPDQAAALRDHIEALLVLVRTTQCFPDPDMNPDPDCPAENHPGCAPEADIASIRGGDGAYPVICHDDRDFAERLYDTITWIEEHAGFTADSQSLSMGTRHAEHVLNCLQTTEPLDWNWDGTVEEICDGRLADYGLSGGADEVANFINMIVVQAKR